MARTRPTTISGYIQAAPSEARPLLRRLHKILESVAPEADQLIKWGVPHFVEPRFLFAFSAFKAHCSFAPTPAALEAFRKELKGYETTKNYLKLQYDEPLPEDLIRKIARYRVKQVRSHEDDSFW